MPAAGRAAGRQAGRRSLQWELPLQEQHTSSIPAAWSASSKCMPCSSVQLAPWLLVTKALPAQVMVMEYVDGGAVLAVGKPGSGSEPLPEEVARQYFRCGPSRQAAWQLRHLWCTAACRMPGTTSQSAQC
jgi:hypothetical protein